MSVADKRLPAEDSDRATLLFVDDERRVLSSMRAMFRRDYDVLVADNGREALQIVDRESVDVIISDQRMPGMTGVEFLTEVKDRCPEVMRILLTGYADLQAIEASINEGEVFRYLMKPCPPDDLKKAIALAVEAARAAESGQTAESESASTTQAEPAELIPFPRSRRPEKPTATVHSIAPREGKTARTTGACTQTRRRSAQRRGHGAVDGQRSA